MFQLLSSNAEKKICVCDVCVRNNMRLVFSVKIEIIFKFKLFYFTMGFLTKLNFLTFYRLLPIDAKWIKSCVFKIFGWSEADLVTIAVIIQDRVWCKVQGLGKRWWKRWLVGSDGTIGDSYSWLFSPSFIQSLCFAYYHKIQFLDGGLTLFRKLHDSLLGLNNFECN